MEMEQIVKRIEWLDDERRKDKNTIATLENRLLNLEGGLPALNQQVKELSGEITRISTSLARFDQIESNLVQLRVDLSRNLDAVEKMRMDHERETDKTRRVELEGINKAIGDVRKGLEPIPELKKSIQARTEEEYRLGTLIEEMGQKIVEGRRSDEEYKRSQRLLEEGQRQDNKRLTDLQGEVSALRKRADEQRGKIDLANDQVHKIEARLSEVFTSENDRKQTQASFIEKQTLIQVERERTWKEWLVRFEAVEKQASGLDAQLQTLDATHRSVKRSQDALDDVTQKIERRTNEITEMQRLSEDRFRSDWTAFKADDQKRWTNYTIAHEEQQSDIDKQFDKITERFAELDDLCQELKETLTQTNEENAKRLQSLLAMAHEWMANYEKVFGRTTK